MLSVNRLREPNDRPSEPALADIAECTDALGWPESLTVVASTAAGYRTLGHGVILEGRLPDAYRHHSPATVLGCCLKGQVRVEWQRGARLSRFLVAPGGFTIVPAGEDNLFRMDRSVQSVNTVFGEHQLRALADREWKPYGPTIEIAPVYQQNAPEIVALAQSFASLLRAPRKGSGLYAETLWTQLAIHILWNYSSLPRRTETWVERLPDARLRRVIDYLDSTLASEISLADLADVAGLSPNYFLSAFKKATGKTPHRFLTEKRVAKACELLSNPQVSIVNVAFAVGYSSQSHLTTVFRRFMNTTPACYRAHITGLGPEEA